MRTILSILFIVASLNSPAQVTPGFVGAMTRHVSGGITYATLDPATAGSDMTISGGNLTWSVGSTSTYNSVLSTLGKSSGKWYIEATCVSGGGGEWFAVGISTSMSSHGSTAYVGGQTTSWGYLSGDGKYWHGGSGSAYGATYAVGSIVGIALDADNGYAYMITGAGGGTWQNGGVPTSGGAGTGAMVGGLSGTIYMAFSTASFSSMSMTVNFGASAFHYSIPAGYSGLH
jgi:hypothetical protein